MTRIEFHVDGDPVPQGSVRAFKSRTGRVVTQNDPTGRIERWRGDVRSAARAVIAPSFEPLSGAIYLRVMFRIARPKSHYLPVTKSRPEPVLRPDAPTWHTAKPDADKLLRAVQDALTAVLYVDDCQIARVHGDKVWDRFAGADITVRELAEL